MKLNKTVVTVLLLTVLLIFVIKNKSKNKNKKYRYYYQCPINDYSTKLFRKVMESEPVSLKRLPVDDQHRWDVLLPCNFNFSEKDFQKIKTNSGHQTVSFVSNSNSIGSKENLWRNLVNKYGVQKSALITPMSYVFSEDRFRFDKNYSPHRQYMMKSEKQRQKGLKLTSNYQEIVNSRDAGYKIVQEYVPQTLGYQGHKINIRMYLLVVCDPNKNFSKKGYMFNDGIVSYSKKKSSTNTKKDSFDSGVSSFYTSKDLYSKFPILLSELTKKMPHIDWDKLKQSFTKKLNLILDAVKDNICSSKLSHNSKSFQLFGVDFLITPKLQCYVLEVNIDPGMESFCKRDRDMRTKLHQNILQVVDIDNRSSCCFKKIWEK